MAKKKVRSKGLKGPKLEKIIEIGRDLFINQSEEGFTTSQLAREVGMKQASLYNYIESKRDLWFAIVIHDLDYLIKELSSISESHKGSQINLILKMAEFYFDIAINSDGIIRLLYRTDAPKRNKKGGNEEQEKERKNKKYKGPYERIYNPAAYYEIFMRVIHKAIEERELEVDKPTYFMFYLFSILHGATLLIGERGFQGQDPSKFKVYVMDRFKEALYKHKL